MLLTTLFQNQILDDLFLGNAEFNFALYVKLISCYFYLSYGLSLILALIGIFSLEEKDVSNSKFIVNVSCCKGFF